MSGLLEGYYDKAVEKTKTLIIEDIERYLQEKDKLPSYEQYLRERGEFIQHIWLNTWINMAGSESSGREKKDYLEEKGIDTEGLTKKMIKQLFRQESRDVKPYNFEGWLDSLYARKEEEWQAFYANVRAKYLEWKENAEIREKNRKLNSKFAYNIEQILGEHYEDLYVYVRYLIGCHLEIEIEGNGIVLSSDDVSFEEYLYNELDMPYNQFYFVEDRTAAYEDMIAAYLDDFGPNWLKQNLPQHLLEEYQQVTNKPVHLTYLREIAADFSRDIASDFFADLLEERLEDLTKLIDIPFDLEHHRNIYIKDRTTREQREREDREEKRKRKEKEKKMLEDIFGSEYSPPAGRDIQYKLHVGETNTGKTFQAIQRMKEAASGLYLAPLRLLALEIYERLNRDGVPCSLITGEEEKLEEGGNHLSCTVEMLREKDFYEVVVIDEAQMIADKDRGFSWYRAITKANAKEVHIICSFHAKTMIIDLLGDSDVEVKEYERETPLQVETASFKLNDTRKGDALVCFSRRGVLETASQIQKMGRQTSMIYGSMPPETRKKQMHRFINGETSVIVCTDAIGMGLNLPIKRVVFLENDKFDGTKRRTLTSQEVKQIAGRAGRRGLYEVGKVAFASETKMMKGLLEKKDEEIHGFTIAPTSAVLKRFQKYSSSLSLFFYLWENFKNPEGTKKATLADEMLLYDIIKDTMVEARFSMDDLFAFLRLPFSANEPLLRAQWKAKMLSIVEDSELPEPVINKSSLEELELSYKSVGLHLLFLYKIGKTTEAHYWERIREEISDLIHEQLKSGVKLGRNVCENCGKELPHRFKHKICNECFFIR